MTQLRAIWWIALVFTFFMLWVEWTHFVQRHEAGDTAITPTQQSSASGQSQQAGDVPQGQPKVAGVENVPNAVAQPSEGRVTVKTDLFTIEFDRKGADLRFASLNDYAVSLEDKSAFTLMSDQSPYLFLAQSGFSGQTGTAPTHHDVFTSLANDHQLADDAQELRVPFTWEKDGIKVEKTYIFKRNSYVIGLEVKVTNQSGQTWQASPYTQLVRNNYDPSASFWLPTYTGGALYDPINKFDKYDLSDVTQQPISQDSTGGWLAMMQHYFLAAVVPDKDANLHYYGKALDANRMALGVVAQPLIIATGESATNSVQLFIGPKLQNELEALAPGLDLVVDYGVLAFMATPMFWVIEFLNNLVEPISGLWSWGWAIILVTILLKAAFYKLSEAGYKSMANLRKLTPRLQHLKDNYSHDKMLFQQKMMELYKTEKINPLGGCLPILIQIPVFLALYWVLLEAVELRMTPFLWLEDLSHYDPFFILPILMGATMIIQQKLNPPPTDPMQEKVMKFLPYLFTVFFLFIPSGLVLYWVVNNTLSIWQQWYITRQIEAQEKPPAHHHG